MPRRGGAIQFANLPGSVTWVMRDFTYVLSSAVGSQVVRFASKVLASIGLPSRSNELPANSPMGGN